MERSLARSEADAPPRDVELVESFLRWLARGCGLADSTVKVYRTALADLRRSLKSRGRTLLDARVEDLDSWLGSSYGRGLSVNTRRTRAAGIRVFYSWALGREKITRNPAILMRPPRAVRRNRASILEPQEIGRVIFSEAPPIPRRPKEPLHFFEKRAAIHPAKIARDRAMLLTQFSLGLRVGELGLFRRSRDLRIERGRQVLLVPVGAKWARQPEPYPLSPDVVEQLEILARELAKARIVTDALFPTLDGPRPLDGISPARAAEVFSEHVRLAKIEPRGRRLTSHVARYSRANQLAEVMSARALQKFMRHADFSTTARYLVDFSVPRARSRAAALSPYGGDRLPSVRTFEEEDPEAPDPDRKRLGSGSIEESAVELSQRRPGRG